MSDRPGSRRKRVWAQSYSRSFCSIFSAQRALWFVWCHKCVSTDCWCCWRVLRLHRTHTHTLTYKCQKLHPFHLYTPKQQLCGEHLYDVVNLYVYACVAEAILITIRSGAARRDFYDQNNAFYELLVLQRPYMLPSWDKLDFRSWHLAKIAVASQRSEPKTATETAHSKKQNSAERRLQQQC